MLDLATKIGSEDMAKSAQLALDEAKKAANQGPANPLKAIFIKLEQDKKRRDQAAANVLQAKEKLAASEKAALDAARQYVVTEIEKDRLLLVNGHVLQTATTNNKPEANLNLPAPGSLNEEQQAAWRKVVAQASAKAAAEAKAELAKTFPDAILDPDEDEVMQGCAKKGKVGEQGLPVVTKDAPAEAGGAAEAARIEREIRLKEADLDGNFRRGRSENDGEQLEFEGPSPSDSQESDAEAAHTVSEEEIKARSVKVLAAALDKAGKDRETKKSIDAETAEELVCNHLMHAIAHMKSLHAYECKNEMI